MSDLLRATLMLVSGLGAIWLARLAYDAYRSDPWEWEERRQRALDRLRREGDPSP